MEMKADESSPMTRLTRRYALLRTSFSLGRRRPRAHIVRSLAQVSTRERSVEGRAGDTPFVFIDRTRGDEAQRVGT
jgi:hypothetical protein